MRVERTLILVHSLRQTAVSVLRPLLAAQPNTPAKIGFAWQIAAGAVLAKASTATWIADGTLRVEARSAEWSNEIRRAKTEILDRLTHLVGAGIVSSIVIVEAPAARRASHFVDRKSYFSRRP